MSLLESIIPHLTAENERLRETVAAYRSGSRDIGEVQSSGRIVSMRTQMIEAHERTIASNQAIIDRYEAGER